MTHDPLHIPNDAPQSDLDLAAAYYDGRLDEPQLAALDARLAADPSFAALVARIAQLDCHLRDALSIAELETRSSQPAIAKPDLSPLRAKVRVPRPAYALAASLLLTAAVVAIYVFAFNLKLETRNPKSAASAPIATLIESTPGTDLFIDNQIANPGDDYKPGRYIIQSGSAELQLKSGASVRMIGYSDLNMRTAMRSSLVRGAAEFTCPPSAVGYTVELPGDVRVVDLGTRFALRVDDDAIAVVQVLEGKVRIDTPAGSHELSTGSAHEIVAGVSTPLTDASRLVVAPPAPPVDPAAFAAAVRKLGPIAYWTGEEQTDGVALDVITQRPARVEGTITTHGSTDNPHFEFDGSSRLRPDYDDALNNPGNRLTIMAWVRVDHIDDQAILHNWSGGLGYTLEIHEGRASFAFGLSNDYADVATAKADAPMPIGRWVLLLGVYDGSTASLYVDGRLVAGMAVTRPDARVCPTTGPITIGARSDGDWGNFRGAIDDAAIFDTALTPQQVADLFDATPPD